MDRYSPSLPPPRPARPWWLRPLARTRLTFRRRPRAAWGGVVSVVCLLLMGTVDEPIAWFFHEDFDRAVGDVFRGFTDVAKGHWWYMVCLGAMGFFGWKALGAPTQDLYAHAMTRVRGAAFTLVNLLASGLIVIVAKVILGRFRPRYLWRDDYYGFQPLNFDTGTLSFPSGHTQVSFAVAASVMVLWPRWAWLAFGIAAIMGLSRVVVLAHFPSDVLMGAYVGIVVTLILRDWTERRFGPLELTPYRPR